MTERISLKKLELVVESINNATGSPLEPYTKDENGKLKANAGCYHLSEAYDGVELHRMSEGGGVNIPLSTGYCSNRELWNAMQGFLSGISIGKELANTRQ